MYNTGDAIQPHSTERSDARWRHNQRRNEDKSGFELRSMLLVEGGSLLIPDSFKTVPRYHTYYGMVVSYLSCF